MRNQVRINDLPSCSMNQMLAQILRRVDHSYFRSVGAMRIVWLVILTMLVFGCVVLQDIHKVQSIKTARDDSVYLFVKTDPSNMPKALGQPSISVLLFRTPRPRPLVGGGHVEAIVDASSIRSEASSLILPTTIQILWYLFHRSKGVESSCSPDGHSLFTVRRMVNR